MHITVSGKQVDVGDALRTYVGEQLGIISGKYFDHALEAQVVFSKARSFFMCDIQMHAGRNIIMRGEGEAQDAHAAFDAAAEHVGKRLRRYRRKVNDHARDQAHRERPTAATQYVLSQDQPAGADDEAETEGVNGIHGVVVAEMPAEIETLTVGEAVMRLDLAHTPVLMFRERKSGSLSVVYRRDDGHIGWIDPSAAKVG
ncbi:ribosome hibernation-promoting factor, HPF/YfiA family [Elioraea sp.]|uniref:ribosome hibernation-promoting factor, HPF/YfiA family n=1 Tax=Elioraea sp. TaxID=2185103 RepID=UPI0025BC6724|nr:ribosome-associated translation inhibitor RaiA [Elioraea sp.]